MPKQGVEPKFLIFQYHCVRISRSFLHCYGLAISIRLIAEPLYSLTEMQSYVELRHRVLYFYRDLPFLFSLYIL